MADDRGMQHKPTRAASREPAAPGWLADAYAELSEPVLRYLSGVAGRVRGEDIASQVWLEATELADGFQGDIGAFRRLVFTIARRRLIDHRRRWWQRRVQLRGDAGDWADRPDPTASAEQAQAFALIARLPRGQAEVVLLRVIAGLSAEDVGEITGRSRGAVRVMQHRALTALASMLEREQRNGV
jgi:RNA polymerase sigma-70 factor (ECF subfamily)